ncbi:hypothetical protein Plhal304r1_c004g0016071 [Plasmopara halstedii]
MMLWYYAYNMYSSYEAFHNLTNKDDDAETGGKDQTESGLGVLLGDAIAG